MQFALKVFQNNNLIHKTRTHKIRRFLKVIRSIKFEDYDLKVYLKVDYGKFIDVYGKKTNFYNDGTYDKEEDFWWAFNAFTED